MSDIQIEISSEPDIKVTVENDCDILIQIQDVPIQVTVQDQNSTIEVLTETPNVSVQVQETVQNIEVKEPLVPEVIEVVLQGSQGPPGPQGPQGPPGTGVAYITKVTDIIQAGVTKFVDSIPLSGFSVLEYIISVRNASESVTRGLKMIVVNSDEKVTNQVYSKLGDSVSFQIDTEIQGSDVKLKVTNLELFDLDLVFVRTNL